MSANPSRYVLKALSATNRDQWDCFVSQHPDGHLLQSWSWGELKSSAGWHPLRLALYDRDGGDILAVAQVLRRGAMHLPLAAGHLAYIPKGPLVDWSQPALCDAFFSQLNALLRSQGALALWVEPACEASTPQGELVLKQLAPLHVHPVHSVQPLRTIVLDLEPSEETLLAQMKEKWRYNLRLASRKGVTVRAAETPDDVCAWYKVLQATGERDHFGIHTLDYYQRVWQLPGAHNATRLLLAEHDGQLLAGIFVSLFARQAIYLYGASSNEQRQLMPNYLLQWEAIRWARQQGALLYDFWGIPDTDASDESMSGVYRFKRGWGGRVVQFPGCFELVYRPLFMHFARRFI